jgi:hypothetical protein
MLLSLNTYRSGKLAPGVRILKGECIEFRTYVLMLFRVDVLYAATAGMSHSYCRCKGSSLTSAYGVGEMALYVLQGLSQIS